MNATPFIIGRHPRALRRWCAFPVIGNQARDFVQWLGKRGYSDATVCLYLEALPRFVRWLRRKGIHSFEQLTQGAIEEAYRRYRPFNQHVGRAVRCLRSFFSEQKIVPEGHRLPPTPSEAECARFGQYLREERGLSESVIQTHTRRLGRFLEFVRFNRDRFCVQRLELCRIEAFLHKAAQTNSRLSMAAVVATVRTFLRWKHAHAVLPRPLHLQIDTPKSYRLEQLPKAISWPQIQELLGSIDRSDALGLRDFSLLYLAAAYGLRSGELVGLTLDDIDWRARSVRVYQRKTQQWLRLPLTDEAATVLIEYLRKARPTISDRHLFLRSQAPAGPMAPAMVARALQRRIRTSGLKLPSCGAHVLRHSFAVHLLRQGVGAKTIGDVLGHRGADSTQVYLRLNLEDLRGVAMALPTPSIAPDLVTAKYHPSHRAPRFPRRLPKRFHSKLAASLQRFVNVKRTLGRRYRCEAAMLGRWDDFLYRRHPSARRIKPAMFFTWTQELNHLTANVRRTYQCVVRSFLCFHAREHPATFIPDLLSLPKHVPAPLPRLVSEAEMARILDAAWRLSSSGSNRLRAETFRLGFILLFCCGLRRNELLRLTLGRIDLGQNLMRIENSKFHKSRLVPFSPTVAKELAQYLRHRQQMRMSTAPETFLMASRVQADRAYADHTLLTVWHQLCLRMHVLDAQGRPPRLHDLRHSFAVNTLQRWYAEGVAVQAKLPHLATYLGHAKAASTHYYLKLTPELRQAACQRFHQRLAPVLMTGGVA
jgi:integrase/recombinase XerD